MSETLVFSAALDCNNFLNGINQIRTSVSQLDLSKGLNTAGLAGNLEKDLVGGASKAVSSAEKAMIGKGEVIGAGLSTKIMTGFNPAQMGATLEKNLAASLGKVQQNFVAQAGMGGQTQQPQDLSGSWLRLLLDWASRQSNQPKSGRS